jgi:hypothetical protein
VTAVHALAEGTAVVEVANTTAAPGCSPPSAASPAWTPAPCSTWTT